ncbi:MAG: manganese catalase family protein [Turicibacter sp.]|jgi:spore coat protein JC|uniref:manganese catalase family protein n=1 Tax=Turicibacter sp. KK003 TaxID=3114695 RepID=UPI00216E2C25|nr:manganese catalase family protein [Turicibacter sp.]
MWIYEKRLQMPVDIKKRDPKMAQNIFSALGGADGELSASMEYLQQRYTMPTDQSIATLTDIGTEELAHLEMLSALIYQLTDGAPIEELKQAGFDSTYSLHGNGIFLADPNGVPWNAGYIAVTSDPVADLTANLAAEQKARAGYEHLLDIATDEDVKSVLRYLREREIVHFQRFGETLMDVQDHFSTNRYFFMKDED